MGMGLFIPTRDIAITSTQWRGHPMGCISHQAASTLVCRSGRLTVENMCTPIKVTQTWLSVWLGHLIVSGLHQEAMIILFDSGILLMGIPHLSITSFLGMRMGMIQCLGHLMASVLFP